MKAERRHGATRRHRDLFSRSRNRNRKHVMLYQHVDTRSVWRCPKERPLLPSSPIPGRSGNASDPSPNRRNTKDRVQCRPNFGETCPASLSWWSVMHSILSSTKGSATWAYPTRRFHDERFAVPLRSLSQPRPDGSLSKTTHGQIDSTTIAHQKHAFL